MYRLSLTVPCSISIVVQHPVYVQQCLVFLSSHSEGKKTEGYKKVTQPVTSFSRILILIDVQSIVERLQSLGQEITNFMMSHQVAMMGEDSDEKLQQVLFTSITMFHRRVDCRELCTVKQEIEEMTSELSTKQNLIETLKQMVSRWQGELESLSREQDQLQDIASLSSNRDS